MAANSPILESPLRRGYLASTSEVGSSFSLDCGATGGSFDVSAGGMEAFAAGGMEVFAAWGIVVLTVQELKRQGD